MDVSSFKLNLYRNKMGRGCFSPIAPEFSMHPSCRSSFVKNIHNTIKTWIQILKIEPIHMGI